MGTQHGVLPPTTPGCTASKAKRVNNVPKRKLYLLFFCIYLKNELKLSINFNFSALVKSNVLLNPFSPVTLWKSDIWKKKTKSTTLNNHISMTRTNLESKLEKRSNLESKVEFSESSFAFLQKSIIFCAS